jgi:hypothetical protein
MGFILEAKGVRLGGRQRRRAAAEPVQRTGRLEIQPRDFLPADVGRQGPLGK